jgi:hypothetical protein
MFFRVFLGVQMALLAVAGTVRADGGKLYSGTFKDAAGRAGPLTCELVAKEDGKWTVSFRGNNTGSGPKKPYQYSGELTGKTEGAVLTLTGEIDTQRQGVYAVTASLADDSLKATFKKKAGGGDGSFELTLDKGKATATP